MGKKHLGTLSLRRQRLLCIGVDWATTFLAFLCFNIFRYYYMHLWPRFPEVQDYLLAPKMIWEQALVPIALLGVYWLSGYYNRPFDRSRLQEMLLTLYSQLFNAVVIYLAALTNDQLYMRRENWMLILILFLLLFTFVYIGRLSVTDNMIKMVRGRNIKPRTVLIGVSPEAMKIALKLNDPSNNPNGHLVGIMPFSNEKETEAGMAWMPDVSRVQGIEELKNMCRNGEVDQVVIVPTEGKSYTKKILHLLYNLYPYDIAIKINPDIISIITPTIRLADILGEPFIDLSSPQVSEFFKNMKRTIDVLVSGLGLLLLSPIFGAMAIAVKRSGPGPVFYSQERVGTHRRPFRIYKFRSMVSDAEKEGVPRLSSDDDPRITRVGKWMRKYRIDEIPQLWNVLKGDMSLVGPRPEREYFIEQIVRKAPWYTLVLQVRPGITSWGMVKYGYASDIDEMIERNRYDLIYLSNMSTAVDFKILIHTIKTVISGAGK